jgi:hypothetical protein
MQPNFFLMIVSILLTAVCWGTYGPILHWGQQDMGGRLRTFICVGIAYFLVAIVIPVVWMQVTRFEMGEGYSWKPIGVTWSLIGGALGAVGALGIILAFTYSPFKPHVSPLIVMPLVFGLAPLVNVAFTLYNNREKGFEAISPFFAAGLLLTAVGAATVLVFAPKAKKAHAHAAPTKTAKELGVPVSTVSAIEKVVEEKLAAERSDDPEAIDEVRNPS